jgi:hypothetical protein
MLYIRHVEGDCGYTQIIVPNSKNHQSLLAEREDDKEQTIE